MNIFKRAFPKPTPFFLKVGIFVLCFLCLSYALVLCAIRIDEVQQDLYEAQARVHLLEMKIDYCRDPEDGGI